MEVLIPFMKREDVLDFLPNNFLSWKSEALWAQMAYSASCLFSSHKGRGSIFLRAAISIGYCCLYPAFLTHIQT